MDKTFWLWFEDFQKLFWNMIWGCKFFSMPLIALMIPYCVALKDSDLQLHHQFHHQQSKCRKKCCDSNRDISLSFLPCKKMADLLCFPYHQFVQKQKKYNFACLIIFAKKTLKKIWLTNCKLWTIIKKRQKCSFCWFLSRSCKQLNIFKYAPVAQLDRVLVYGTCSTFLLFLLVLASKTSLRKQMSALPKQKIVLGPRLQPLVPFKELQTTEYFQICTRSSIG